MKVFGLNTELHEPLPENGGEYLQKWPICQNVFKATVPPDPRSFKRSKKKFQRTAGICNFSWGQYSWLTHKKETEKKWHQERAAWQKALPKKRIIKAHLYLLKSILDDPQEFWEYIVLYSMDRWVKIELSGGGESTPLWDCKEMFFCTGILDTWRQLLMRISGHQCVSWG